MFKSLKKFCGLFIAIVFFGMASGCGGGGGGSASSSGSVSGVATPSSISVVTANNAD